MKRKYTYLNELTDKSSSFTLKVRCDQKARPTQSPTKRYQRIKFTDEMGNEMRATLFDDDIQKFEQALQQGGEYEISDVPIRPVPQQYQVRPNEFQMNFNDRVKVIPINTKAAALLPKYLNLEAVPRNANPKDRFDIIGIVLFVDEPKMVKRGEREQEVREILLTDHSSTHPLVISLWDDLARDGSNVLDAWAQSFMIVGFTDMQASTHRGFSLRSSASTAINVNPEDAKAEILVKWISEKESVLLDRRSKAMLIKYPTNEKIITTMAQITAKKANTTWQDEKFWVKATIPEATLNNLRSYLGCSACGRRGEAENGSKYKCGFCNATDSTCIPRVNFAFDATDGTDTKKFTIFNEHVETLFGMKCEDLIKLKIEQSEDLPEEVGELQTKEVLLQVGPTIGLSTSQMLKWTVRSIVLE